jgi:peptide/nickel transport system substrate-binding protein
MPRLLAALLVVCAVSAPAGARAETVLRARLNSDILSSEPGMKRDENTDAVLLHVAEGLVASRADGSVAPMLASGWTVSADGRTYSFRLREGVSFHNGVPLNSTDAVWSLRRYFDPNSRWRCRSAFGAKGIARIQAVRAVGPRQVDVVLDRKAPLFLKTLARTDCGSAAILQRASVGADGRWRTPVGTGPFRFGPWRRNQYVELLRYPGYRSLPGPRDGNGGGKQALVDRVRFMVIPDGSAASAALLRGSLDVLDGLAPNEVAHVQRAPGVRLVASPTMDFYAILLQTQDPVLRDPRLRRALALAIDVKGIARVAGHGQALADSSPIPVVSPYHKGLQRRPIARDLAAARALVKASGYRGQRIKLITNRRYPQAFDAAIIVQAMARDAGINLDIEISDWAGQVSRYSTGDYQAMVFGFSARLDPSLNYETLIGDKASDPRKVWGSARARDLLRQSIEAEAPAQRQAVFDALEREFRRDAPAVILFNTKRVTAVRAGVVGYESWPGALQRLWGVGLKGR